MKISSIVFWLAATALGGCSDRHSKLESLPVTDPVEGLRGLYPGGAEFEVYSQLVISFGGEIVPELIKASKDADPKMRESAARCLGKIATDEAVTRLIEMTSDDQIKETIWIALAYGASPRAIPTLQAELVNHAAQSVYRGRLLITLVECGDETQLSPLLEYMKTCNLEGHIYGANVAFEKVAGRRFKKDTKKIEEWLRERKK